MEGLEKYYEFSPSDQRLIDAYLRRKIAGKDVGSGSIHDADVTSNHPYHLVRKHAPAPGSLNGGVDKGVWFFFSPKRYVGNSKASARSGSRLRNWARTVLGVDGKKKGAWHTEGRKKTVHGSSGGYFQKLSYEEVTPSGSVVKTGWLMIEYAIEEDHGGGGAMVIGKVYKSPRGPGSDVPSSSSKRKADVVEQPVVEQLQRPWNRTHEEAGHVFGWQPAAARGLDNDRLLRGCAGGVSRYRSHIGKRRIGDVGGPMHREDKSGA
ncbi:unnamed protein product [Miscanthus lutarioriparius]|uniref:NAC domain-containing protein n=1 Tax=Miscanthus lutarioriparius TaxID=422564 RepID=A0A811MJC4_9POAL|nr:unnamed protein product [Miscanthus lutarioriparius]